ncbi:SprT-like domain-containing protein [Haliea sp. E1-2-M8]|uniref:SprT family zinc-dependent metalloprotease n=1 Tax=Haliea sp. E1-2-M8 TaxID=3064706 RepID=UPI002722507C|nr:SprT-like domain-containing protein [Haliea sp. E1-2-M8]MDO8860685.1 SprT-like domain-containing protein [Haliea sp. E1-2-M8]
MTIFIPTEQTSAVLPIGQPQRAEVVAATEAWIERAAQMLALPLAPVPVLFDLRGTSAGMFRARGRDCWIRFNPWIFAKHFEDNLHFTVPHEVAHYAVHCQRHRRRVRPHGPEWQRVMRGFGLPPEVTFKLDLSGIPVRRQQRHAYRCGCRDHAVSTVRHKRMREGRARYLCRYCDAALLPVD